MLSEKAPKYTRQDRKVLWVFTVIFAYWPGGNEQVCIFARENFVFPLRRPLPEALLLLDITCLCIRKILLKYSVSERTLFPDTEEK